MSPAVTIFTDSDDLAVHAADLITQATQKAIRARGCAMLALAGGSTPKKTYSVLAQPARRSRIDWAHTYLFFGDERFVRLDDPSSNFAKEALAQIEKPTCVVAKPAPLQPATPPAAQPLKLPVYEVGTEAATRKAFGDALVAVGANRPEVVVLDGEVSNSTFTEEFNKAYPGRFFEVYIAEQQLVSAALGLSVLGKIAFAATFAAFLTRAYEQLKSEGIRVRVIDAYSLKPIDKEALHEAARVAGGRLVVVEDHWPEGGLGDAVLDAFAGVMEKTPTVVKLAVRSTPTSGTPAELLSAAGIDAEHIAQAVRERP